MGGGRWEVRVRELRVSEVRGERWELRVSEVYKSEGGERWEV